MAKLLFMTINDLFTSYIKNNNIDMNKTNIIVVSRDIEGERKRDTRTGSDYESKYKNIDFCIELSPSPHVMEMYTGSSTSMYVEAYQEQLMNTTSVQKDLCAIVDMIVNDGYDIIIICSISEMNMQYFYILRDYIDQVFRLHGYMYQELKDDDTLNSDDIGDITEIKKMLNYQLKTLELIDENIGEFFNKFKNDLADKYKEVLLNKTIDELVNIGRNKGLYINKHKPKEVIIDHILKKMLEK